MVVMLVLVGLLLFGAYAGVTGRFAADSRDPDFGWRWSEAAEPKQQVPYGPAHLPAQPGNEPVDRGPVVERPQLDVEDSPGHLRVGLLRELAG